jgi:hypothetical protein
VVIRISAVSATRIGFENLSIIENRLTRKDEAETGNHQANTSRKRKRKNPTSPSPWNMKACHSSISINLN